jgi:hypothetical protein
MAIQAAGFLLEIGKVIKISRHDAAFPVLVGGITRKVT